MSGVAFLWAQAAAGRFGRTRAAAPAQGLDDLDAALVGTPAGRADGLIVIGAGRVFGPLVARIVESAAPHRLPSVSAAVSFAPLGGLLASGANAPDNYRRAATCVDNIPRGGRPIDLPVERPTRIEFSINLKAAGSLGLTLPQSSLEQATEIIQKLHIPALCSFASGLTRLPSKLLARCSRGATV